MLLTVATLAGCSAERSAPEVEPNAAIAVKPTLSFDNIILTESDQQGKGQLWELKAKKAEYSRDGKVAMVMGIEGAFFEKGQKTLLVKAREGQIQTEARMIILSGNVEARSVRRKTTFTTQQIRWLPDQNRIEATGEVILQEPVQRLTITGNRLEGDLAGNQMTLSGKVTAKAAQRDFTLHATQAVWNVDQALVQAQEITATALQDSIQAPQASWDLKRQTLELTRGLTYQRTRPKLNLMADTARWEQQPNRITAQGNINYRQGTLQVRGNTAIADLQTGTVEVKGEVNTVLEAVALR